MLLNVNMLFGVKWYYWIILLGAAIGALLMWIKALKSSRERREKLKREGAIWKRDYELREKFTVLTDTKIKETDVTELLHGVAMHIQVKLEKATNMNEAFEALTEQEKFVYALEYFDEDCKNGLSVFFKNNGAPLVPVIPEALNAVGAHKYTDIVASLVPMYDPDSDISIDYDVVARADEEFDELFDSDEFCRLAAEYIRKNKEIFLK